VRENPKRGFIVQNHPANMVIMIPIQYILLIILISYIRV